MEGSSLPALLVRLLVTETVTKHSSANGHVTPTATKTPQAPDLWGGGGQNVGATSAPTGRGSAVQTLMFMNEFITFFKMNLQNANQETYMETHLQLPMTGHFPAANTTPRGRLFCFSVLANNHI